MQMRHVKDDVIKVARLEIWHHVEEFLQTELGRTRARRSNRSQIEILRGRINCPVGSESGIQRICRFAFEEGMNLVGPEVHIYE